jgi:sec-independent protein translocase protein TatA
MGLDNPIHIAFLLILLLLVFGAKRLPEMGRSLGHGMRGFKDALSGEIADPLAATTTTSVNTDQPAQISSQPAQTPTQPALAVAQPAVGAADGQMTAGPQPELAQPEPEKVAV